MPRHFPIICCVFFVGISIVPLFSQNPYILGILTMANLYAIWAMSWDIFSGYTGEVNFGHAFFIGVAGFSSAIIWQHFELKPWLTISIGSMVALSLAFIIGFLTLRLRGPYFAIITLALNIAFAELALILWKWTGGEEGIAGIEPLTPGPVWDFYVSLILSFLVFSFLWYLANSKFGKILISIRENEDAAEASGINSVIYRITTFSLAGFIAGIGGGFHVHIQMHASHDLLSVMLSALILIMTIFGGMGTIFGPLFGAYFLFILSELLRGIEEYRMLLFTIILLLTIFLAPNGLILKFREFFPFHRSEKTQ